MQFAFRYFLKQIGTVKMTWLQFGANGICFNSTVNLCRL